MFTDRTDGGQQLAELLERHDVQADIVLGIPRGALPVARPVADALNAPLDVVVASKIGAPNNPKLAIGAVASDGSVWRNEDLIDRVGISDEHIEREREREAEYAQQKAEQYRTDKEAPDLSGKRVVIVDDGVATGATAKACLQQVADAGASHILLAVPVGSPDSIDDLQTEADDVLVVESPPEFRAVGQYYERFDQVSDEEAIAYLGNSRSSNE
jgi:predicted phosphoribosyltransferase